MDTVLVTGAAGFVGSNLSKELLLRGYRVVGVDNFDDTYNPSFKEAHVAPLISHPNFVLHRVDICDREALKEVFIQEQPQRVAHLAAKVDTRQAVTEPHAYVDVNLHGTLAVFDAARDVGVANIVFVSSSSVYGNSADVPWRETATADLPLSPYGATKRAGELFAYSYHHNFDLPITCLRYFNVYGENNRPSMVPYLWAEAFLRGTPIEISGGGTRKRDYTYVSDTVAATIAALEKPLGYAVINIGNHSPVSLRELLHTFETVTGKTVEVRERESHKASVEETFADVARAKELLGWEPTVSIEDGVERLVSWFRDNRL